MRSRIEERAETQDEKIARLEKAEDYWKKKALWHLERGGYALALEFTQKALDAFEASVRASQGF